MSALLEVTSQVMVQAEQERVWQAVVDWPRQREWVWATRVHGGQGAGAEVVGRTGIGPIGFTDTMVITEWDPPRRCVVRHTGRVVRGSGAFEVEPRGKHSVFTWTEQLELPWFLAGGVARAAVRRFAQIGLDSSLRRFARLFANA
jgi:carbon monoxide dehydrogenase subunit G